MNRRGDIFIITGPSGTGKTTIINHVFDKDISRLGYCISHTTRKPRAGEINGSHYYFVEESLFERMIKADEFVEWAVVYGHYYGTSVASMEKGLSSGGDVLMDLDIQGAQAVRRKFSESVSVFILPPSLAILKKRLQGRASRTKKTDVDLRFKQALGEIQKCRDYDYIIMNNDLEVAINELEAIIIARRACKERRLPLAQKLFYI